MNVTGITREQQISKLWVQEDGQNIAEYAVMLTVISLFSWSAQFGWWINQFVYGRPHGSDLVSAYLY